MALQWLDQPGREIDDRCGVCLAHMRVQRLSGGKQHRFCPYEGFAWHIMEKIEGDKGYGDGSRTRVRQGGAA